MTALKQYQRLEASGLWRAKPDDQRREVIVSIGDATLTMTDMKEQPLAHWSLAALQRVNPGQFPAIYYPVGDPGETLEIAEDETSMIDAIEKLRRAMDRARPHPGRLRHLGMASVMAAVLGLGVFWLPDALVRQTVSVVPDIRRQDIGQALLDRIERVAGRACFSTETAPVLSSFARRMGVRRLVVLRDGVPDTRHLPGRIILLNKALIENNEDPAVLAGYILTERLRAEQSDPLADLLSEAGPLATFRLLTTGQLTQDTLDRYAEHVLVETRPPLPPAAVVDAFKAAGVPSTPYAYAIDPTGETVLELIEADPMAGTDPEPVLRDRDWVLLQTICGD
jgi:GNAT superfamily N-acetyltransferase